MLPPDCALVCAQQPAFQERGNPVNPGQQRIGGLPAPKHDPPVVAIPEPGEPP